MIEIGYYNLQGEWTSTAGPFATRKDAELEFSDRDLKNNKAAEYMIRDDSPDYRDSGYSDIK